MIELKDFWADSLPMISWYATLKNLFYGVFVLGLWCDVCNAHIFGGRYTLLHNGHKLLRLLSKIKQAVHNRKKVKGLAYRQSVEAPNGGIFFLLCILNIF